MSADRPPAHGNHGEINQSQQQQQQQTIGPFLLDQSSLQCKAGCGFFGNPEWLGYCSICYKQLNPEYQQHRPQYFPCHPQSSLHHRQQPPPAYRPSQFTFNQEPHTGGSTAIHSTNSQVRPSYSVTQYRQQVVYPTPTVLNQGYYANPYDRQPNQSVDPPNPLARSPNTSFVSSMSQPSTPIPNSVIAPQQQQSQINLAHQNSPVSEISELSFERDNNNRSDSNQTLASLDTPNKISGNSNSNILSNLTSPTSLVMMGYDTLTNLHNTILNTAKSSFRASPSASTDGVDSFSVHSTSQSEYQMRQKFAKKQVSFKVVSHR